MYHQKLTLEFGDTIELRYCLLRQGDFTMKGAYHRITERITRVRLGDASFSLPNRITRFRLGDTAVSLLKCITKAKKAKLEIIITKAYHRNDTLR